jgi:ATP-binding cassette subfamily B protein
VTQTTTGPGADRAKLKESGSPSRWLWGYLRRHRSRIGIGLLLSLVVTGLNLVNPMLTRDLVDKVIIKGDTNLLWIILCVMLGTVVAKSLIRFGYQMMFEHASQDTIRRIREQLFHKLQGMDHGYYDRTKTGDIMAHMTGDIDAVRHLISWVIYQSSENGVIFIAAIIAMATINWQFTLLMVAVTPLIAWAALSLSRSVKPTFTKIREQFSRLNSVVQENIAGNRVVKALTREDYEIRKFMKENDEYRERNLESGRVWGTYIPLIELFSGLLAAVVILAGGILVIQGHLSLGELVAFNSLVWAITNPLRMAGWLVNDFERFRASAERLSKLDALGSALTDSPQALPLERLSGKVEFHQVSFSYGDETVLQDISFTALPGQTIGILGPTGAGKSSLARLICRFYDRSGGDILLDGHDIRDIRLDSLRNNVGITMQDVFLFSDTIEGNIAFGKPQASVEEVIHAATLANAHEFVKNLPEGYDTIIGERGVGLSGGQRQRVALARLLLKSPPILILDDTTSAVDIETEERIQHAIRNLHGQHTLFVIAHRLSSIMHADQILVIRDGRIAEQGKHDELIARQGYYAEVWRHQTGVEV